MSQDKISLGNSCVVFSTKDAILVKLDTDNSKLWVPKSVIHEDSLLWKGEKGEEGDLVVQEWWARDKALI